MSLIETDETVATKKTYVVGHPSELYPHTSPTFYEPARPIEPNVVKVHKKIFLLIFISRSDRMVCTGLILTHRQRLLKAIDPSRM